MYYFGQQSCLDLADKPGLSSLEEQNSRIMDEGYEPIGAKRKQRAKDGWTDGREQTSRRAGRHGCVVSFHVICIVFYLMLHHGMKRKKEEQTASP